MKAKCFNFRPICVVCVFLLLGSVFSFYMTSNAFFTLGVTVAGFGLFFASQIMKKTIKFFVLALVCFLLGAGIYSVAVSLFTQDIVSIPTSIQARICAVETPEDGRITVKADSCYFDGSKHSGKIIIYIYDNDNLFQNIEIGRVITFAPLGFYQTDLYYYGTPNATYFGQNLKFSATVYASNITFSGVEKTLAEKVKEYVKNRLLVGLSSENADVAYSALFGDKDSLSDTQYTAYRLSGVAHLLAVSGLHVGIIVGILNWLLRRLHITHWYKLGIISAILLFYMYLCGFSVSVVRASIMAVIMMLSGLLYRQYDSLSAIAFAGIIIFLINPLSAFNVSFLMSFSCVVGITLLYKSIRSVLAHTKLKNAILETLSMSLATAISLMVVMAYFYNTLNVISLLANILLIPLFTVAFLAVFLCSAVSFVIPAVSYVLYAVNPIMDVINLAANILGKLPFANFSTISFSYISIILYFALLLCISRFCLLSKKGKVASSLTITSLLVMALVI